MHQAGSGVSSSSQSHPAPGLAARESAAGWAFAALDGERRPRSLDAAVELACFWGARCVDVSTVEPGHRYAVDGLRLSWEGPRVSLEAAPGSTVEAGATALAPRHGALLTLAPGERALVLDGPLCWAVRFVRASRAQPAEAPSPEDLRFFKLVGCAVLFLNAGWLAAHVAELGGGDGDSLFSARAQYSRWLAPGFVAPPKRALAELTRTKALARRTPPSPDQATSRGAPVAPPRRTSTTERRDEARLLAASLFAGPGGGLSTVFGSNTLGAELHQLANSLAGTGPSGDARGLAGLGTRGSDPGGPLGGFGIGGLGTSSGPGGPRGNRFGTFEFSGSGHSHCTIGAAPVVVGGLDKDVIRKVILRHQSEVRFCYESALPTSPGLEGKVALAFVIGPSGEVTSAQVSESTLGSAAVEACILERARRWRFPEPKGGGEVSVNFPWILRTAGEE